MWQAGAKMQTQPPKIQTQSHPSEFGHKWPTGRISGTIPDESELTVYTPRLSHTLPCCWEMGDGLIARRWDSVQLSSWVFLSIPGGQFYRVGMLSFKVRGPVTARERSKANT